MGELRNEFLQMFGETYFFYQKKVFIYIIFLNKKIKWLKLLFTSPLKAKKYTYLLLNKGPSAFVK